MANQGFEVSHSDMSQRKDLPDYLTGADGLKGVGGAERTNSTSSTTIPSGVDRLLMTSGCTRKSVWKDFKLD